MPERLYYDRILTMTAWKVKHLDRPLKELKKIRKRTHRKIKCRKKPYLKSCKNFAIKIAEESFTDQYLLNYPPPKKWVHWSSSKEIDDHLKTITNSQIERYLNGEINLLSNFDPDIIKMHVLSEKLSRSIKLKYSTNSFRQFNDIPWWYFLILLILVLLNIHLCKNYHSTADTKNER